MDRVIDRMMAGGSRKGKESMVRVTGRTVAGKGKKI
jgi:hypothetical protein